MENRSSSHRDGSGSAEMIAGLTMLLVILASIAVVISVFLGLI